MTMCESKAEERKKKADELFTKKIEAVDRPRTTKPKAEPKPKPESAKEKRAKAIAEEAKSMLERERKQAAADAKIRETKIEEEMKGRNEKTPSEINDIKE